MQSSESYTWKKQPCFINYLPKYTVEVAFSTSSTLSAENLQRFAEGRFELNTVI